MEPFHGHVFPSVFDLELYLAYPTSLSFQTWNIRIRTGPKVEQEAGSTHQDRMLWICNAPHASFAPCRHLSCMETDGFLSCFSIFSIYTLHGTDGEELQVRRRRCMPTITKDSHRHALFTSSSYGCIDFHLRRSREFPTTLHRRPARSDAFLSSLSLRATRAHLSSSSFLFLFKRRSSKAPFSRAETWKTSSFPTFRTRLRAKVRGAGGGDGRHKFACASKNRFVSLRRARCVEKGDASKRTTWNCARVRLTFRGFRNVGKNILFLLG